MRILMPGNSFTSSNQMPQMLAKLTGKGWDYDEMSRRLSDAYHKAAKENQALTADAGRRFYELSAVQTLYAADGAHPNAAGSGIAAQTIAAVIQQHKETQR